MEKAAILKIFLASPNDVKSERDIIFALKDDLDHLIGKPNKLRFEFVNWERNAYPGVGDDAQDVINKNIGDDYNIFIGIFWQRFGTPTNRSESGTKEEYDNAYKKYKKDPHSNHIMIYFKTAPPTSIYDLDYEQFKKVKEFKNEVQKAGVLYWEFEKADDLKNLILIHLATLVRDKYSSEKNEELESERKNNKEQKLDKYDLIASQIDEGKSSITVEGILDLLETSTDAMGQLPNITYNIEKTIEFIGSRFEEKTKQINAIGHIKDDRLRLNKATQTINNLALDLDKYSTDLNELMPEFTDTLNIAIESYTKLLLSASESSVFIDEVEEQLQTVVPTLYETIDTSLVTIAGFLEVLTGLPVMTSKFGTAKRKAELATNALFKEFINSKKILKQLIEK